MRRFSIVLLGFALVALALSLAVWGQLPERMASHWNAAGEVDGYMSRFWGAMLMPLFMLGMAALFVAIPLVDPLRANIEAFRPHYEGFAILMMAFMLVMHGVTLLWNLGVQVPIGPVVVVGVAVLFFYVGTLLENAKRNFFVGIRTPWTLSSDRVWDKTHKAGAWVFRVLAVLMLGAVFWPEVMIWVVLSGALLAVSGLLVYSYLEYRKEHSLEA